MNTPENNGIPTAYEKQLIVTNEAKAYIRGVLPWIEFLNIITAIAIAGCILIGLGLALPTNNRAMIQGFTCILTGIVYIFPLKKSFNLARQARNAVDTNDENELCNMFKSMKYICKYMGIMTILSLCFVVIFLLICAILIVDE